MQTSTTMFPPSPPHPNTGHLQQLQQAVHPQGLGNNLATFPNTGITTISSAPSWGAAAGGSVINVNTSFAGSASGAIGLLQTKVQKTAVQFTTQFQGLSGFTAYPGVPTMSSDIDLQDRTWRLVIFPGGVEEQAKGFISCFLQCLSPGSTRAIYRISIMNQMGWKNHSISSEQVRVFQGPAESELHLQENEPITGETQLQLLSRRNHMLLPSILHGEDKFISWNEVKQASNGHCVDDCLIIRADIVVYGEVEKNVLSSPNPFLTLSRHFDANDCQQGVSSLAGHVNTSTTAAAAGVSQPSPAGIAPTFTSQTRRFPFPLLKDQLATMFNDRQSSDFVVKVFPPSSMVSRAGSGSETSDTGASDSQSVGRYLYVHKFILCMRSPVFKAMIYDCGNMRESSSNELVVTERIPGDTMQTHDDHNANDFFVSYESLHEFFYYLYTDTCHMQEVLPKYAQELLALACKYQVEGLRCICENYLSAMLAPCNALILLEMADTFGSDGLKFKAISYVAQNLRAVLTAAVEGEEAGSHENNSNNRTDVSDLQASLNPRLCMEVLQAVAGIHPFQLYQQQQQQYDAHNNVHRRSRAGSRLHESTNQQHVVIDPL